MFSFIPPLNDLVVRCQEQHVAIGVLLMGIGLVFLIMGLRMYKALVSLSFAAAGVVIGQNLPVSEPLQWVCGGVGAVVLALASSYLMKLAVAILGGGWAGLLVLALTIQFGLPDFICLVAGGLALILVASLALTFYNQLIAFITSLEGSLLFLGGLIPVLARVPSVWGELRGILVDNPYFAPFFIGAGTVMGFYLQLAESRQQESGMSG
jgi:hypothetical protein